LGSPDDDSITKFTKTHEEESSNDRRAGGQEARRADSAGRPAAQAGRRARRFAAPAECSARFTTPPGWCLILNEQQNNS
jgi:hypothetical protein